MADRNVPKSDLIDTDRLSRDFARAVAVRDTNGVERRVLAWGQPGTPNTGIVRYPPRATLGPRLQKDYQLVLVHTGSAHVQAGDAQRAIPAGHVGLQLPGRIEFYAFSPDKETRHSWLAAPATSLNADLIAELDHAPLLLPISDCMTLACELAMEAVKCDKPGTFPLLGAIVQAALTLYVAEARRQISEASQEHPALRQAREIARLHAWEGVRVSTLAREIGLSPEHLARLFRRELGTTPGALLREERLRHATTLLEQTGLSIGEVARHSGFASSQQFARALRSATGMSPHELRARTRINAECANGRA